MNLKTNGNRISGLMALVLFLIFSICILAVLLSAAEAYQRLNERNALSGDERTSMLFLSTKIRQYDTSGSIRADEFDGASALILTEELDGERFKTVLYCHEGYLYELFAPETLDAQRGDGEPILPLAAMDVTIEDRLLTLRLSQPDGAQTCQRLLLRSGEGDE